MKSTWLLFKTQRRSLFIQAPICFIVPFLMFLPIDFQHNSENTRLIPLLTLGLTFLLADFGQYHRRLFRFPFQVTYRQLAWMPTFSIALLWCICLLGAVSVYPVIQLLKPYPIGELWNHLKPAWQILPLAFLLFCSVDRLARNSQVSFGWVIAYGYLLVFYFDDHRLYDLLSAGYRYGWPVCIFIGILFILEAPAHIAAMEKPIPKTIGTNTSFMRAPSSVKRMSILRAFNDMIIIAPFSFMLYVILYVIINTYLENLENLKLLAVVLSLAVGCLIFLLFIWYHIMCNGFSKRKTLLLIFLRCSILFWPLTYLLGARQGEFAVCMHCKNHKHVWVRRCPHCGQINPLNTPGIAENKEWLSKTDITCFRPSRIFLPLILIMPLLFASEGLYTSEETTLTLDKAVFEDSETLCMQIHEFIQSKGDIRDWMDTDETKSIPIPKQFRIEVDAISGKLRVRCFSLTPATDIEARKHTHALSLLVAQKLYNTFPEAITAVNEKAIGMRFGDSKANRWYVLYYLDNDIHWEPPENNIIQPPIDIEEFRRKRRRELPERGGSSPRIR